MRDLLQTMMISEVKHYEGKNNVPLIYFKFDDTPYFLHIAKKEGEYIPVALQHLSREEKPCPICEKQYAPIRLGFCKVFKEEEYFLLFQRLIQENSIRLIWLFLLSKKDGRDENG